MKTSDQDFQVWKKKMLFAAKRGNLECELLLIKFIEKMELCPQEERKLLESFLKESDQVLFHWLLKPHNQPLLAHHSPIPEKYRPIIKQIQTVYLS